MRDGLTKGHRIARLVLLDLNSLSKNPRTACIECSWGTLTGVITTISKKMSGRIDWWLTSCVASSIRMVEPRFQQTGAHVETMTMTELLTHKAFAD